MSAVPRRYPSILILFAHPYPHRSRVNRQLIEAVNGLEGVEINDLYENYPDFHIDIQREQALLQAADLVIFQHPVYWYSAPALLKQWQDQVLEYGFAYGKEGTKLHGKGLLSAITTGHSQQAYCPQGEDRYTVREMLRPFEQTAHHCGMHFLPPFVIHGAHKLSSDELVTYAESYRQLLLNHIRGNDNG
ncbi:MAG: NAD(P)H-dependent oxidoreductase [Candidatus Sedimenticola sp. 20ELBAFRAG]